MSSLDQEPPDSNPTIDDVMAFAKTMSDRGVYNPKSASLYRSSLKSITSVLQPDEPTTARWLLDNIEQIADRWANKNYSKAETTTTYRSKAKTLLTDFFAFREDPGSFKVKQREPSKASPKKAAPPKTVEDGGPDEEVVVPANGDRTARKVADPSVFHLAFPLSSGGCAEFYFPTSEGGRPDISREDVVKIAMNLLTLSKDFTIADVRLIAKLSAGELD